MGERRRQNQKRILRGLPPLFLLPLPLMLPPNIDEDIRYILETVIGAAGPADELALLRVSLRRYLEGQSAVDAVAWAAEELSKSISNY